MIHCLKLNSDVSEKRVNQCLNRNGFDMPLVFFFFWSRKATKTIFYNFFFLLFSKVILMCCLMVLGGLLTVNSRPLPPSCPLSEALGAFVNVTLQTGMFHLPSLITGVVHGHFPVFCVEVLRCPSRGPSACPFLWFM